MPNPHYVLQILDSQVLEVGKLKSELQHVAELACGETEYECRQSRVEVREVRVVDPTPRDGVVCVNRKGVNPVEGLEVLKMGFQEVWAELWSQTDIQTPGILEETALSHERQEAEFEFATAPLCVLLLLCGGEYSPVGPAGNM